MRTLLEAPPLSNSRATGCRDWDNRCPAIEITELNAAGAAVAVVEVFEAMSADARYYRFFGPMPRLPQSALRALTALDPARHRAWAARCGDVAVGLVRVVYDRNGDVELAVEVADDHGGRGLGRRLVEMALDRVGVEWGETTVTLVVHPQNRRAAGLFRAMGTEFTYDEGVLMGELATDRPGRAGGLTLIG